MFGTTYSINDTCLYSSDIPILGVHSYTMAIIENVDTTKHMMYVTKPIWLHYLVFKWHTTLRQYSKLPIMKPVKHVVLQCVYGN